MIETIAFNTGRKYAADGQPITAARDPATGDVAFVDHARLIEGILRDRPRLSAATLLAAYDAGRYEMPRAADLALIAAARRVEGGAA
jgi:hypothetical protein